MPRSDGVLHARRERPLIVVAGLAFEARIAAEDAADQVRVLCGIGAPALAVQLDALLRDGCAGVLSFGTAGALVDRLGAGDWLVASAAVAAGERYQADPAWRDSLLRLLAPAANSVRRAPPVAAVLAGAAAPVVSSADKRALHITTGAAAVDMETLLVARAAATHQVPFAACRVIVDPVQRTLPPAALVAMRPDGSTDLRAVLGALLVQPTQLPALLRLARDAAAARRALIDGRRLLGPHLGFADVAQFDLDMP